MTWIKQGGGRPPTGTTRVYLRRAILVIAEVIDPDVSGESLEPFHVPAPRTVPPMVPLPGVVYEFRGLAELAAVRGALYESRGDLDTSDKLRDIARQLFDIADGIEDDVVVR